MAQPNLPPIRACIFDMDGLLIDSEDLYTKVTNTILRENNRPDLPWSIKAQLQGRPGPEAGRIFRAWANLPISDEQFFKRQTELQRDLFRQCKPLLGVELLLDRLSRAHTMLDERARARSPSSDRRPVRMALATSSHRRNFDIKTAHIKRMFDVFPVEQIIVGDDERIPKGRGKPLPDIYLLALQSINEKIEAEGRGERPVLPEECLVFEDSVPGVEAGRRAGMRVVWVPHDGLLGIYQDREKEVLAGSTGEHKEEDLAHQGSSPLPGSPGNVGKIDDGWAERLTSLQHFDFAKYGIDYVDQRVRSESGQIALPGTTDKELEEMTARADGKIHAPEEGTPSSEAPREGKPTSTL